MKKVILVAVVSAFSTVCFAQTDANQKSVKAARQTTTTTTTPSFTNATGQSSNAVKVTKTEIDAKVNDVTTKPTAAIVSPSTQVKLVKHAAATSKTKAGSKQ